MLIHKLTLLLFLLLALDSGAQSLANDTVYLIDGSFITGEILNPGSENSIQIKNVNGAIIYVKNQRIEKLVLDTNRPISTPKTEFDTQYPKNTPHKKTEDGVGYRNRLLSINFLLGIPVGVFGSKSTNNPSAAGALPGLGFELRYLRKIDPTLYWSLNLRYIRYGFNTDILIPTIEQQTGLTPLTISNAYWETISYGGGLHWFQPINDEFKLSVSASIQLQTMRIPEINVLFNGGSGTFDEQRGSGISPDIAATFIYKERFFFKLNFTTSRMNFFGNSSTGQGAFIQKANALGIGIGVLIPKLRQ